VGGASRDRAPARLHSIEPSLCLPGRAASGVCCGVAAQYHWLCVITVSRRLHGWSRSRPRISVSVWAQSFRTRGLQGQGVGTGLCCVYGNCCTCHIRHQRIHLQVGLISLTKNACVSKGAQGRRSLVGRGQWCCWNQPRWHNHFPIRLQHGPECAVSIFDVGRDVGDDDCAELSRYGDQSMRTEQVGVDRRPPHRRLLAPCLGALRAGNQLVFQGRDVGPKVPSIPMYRTSGSVSAPPAPFLGLAKWL
jgi:hypothetical protein